LLCIKMAMATDSGFVIFQKLRCSKKFRKYRS
jgi:hypothetical protein